MAKKFIKKYLPDTQKIRNHRHLKVFGAIIHNPNLWHLNRYSVSTAFSVGLFTAFLPVPMQMLISAALAIIFHANLPISVALVWLTNPFTMPPLFYFSFKVGAFVLNIPPTGFHFEPTVEWLTTGFLHIWKPFLLGCVLTGLTLGMIFNIGIRLIWRLSVTRSWRLRRSRRRGRRSHGS